MNKTVLIVEDNQDYRELLKKKLTEEGFEVVTAADGESALNIVNNTQYLFNLVLLDILMPGMDGITFYYKLTTVLQKNIPVIILTNLSQSAYPADVKDYIVKSDISMEELVARIKSTIA